KTPTHEYYGFVIYLVSFVFYGVFLCWAYLPKQALIYLGFEYYPDKQWALRVPAWSIMAIIYILITSIGYQLMTALPLNSIRTLADKMSNI
ncbi:PIG-P, partial [Ramicandelaber brevisporus]